MLKENHFVLNPPSNRLIGELPKIGIRPVIDGRRHGIRESLESPTLAMAEQVAKLLTSNLRHACGLPVECVVSDTCIGGVAEAAQAADKFSRERVGVSITVTPCWCYGSETMDMSPEIPKAVWGFNGTERPGAVYLAAVLAAYNQKGLPAFSIYGHDVQDAGVGNDSDLSDALGYETPVAADAPYNEWIAAYAGTVQRIAKDYPNLSLIGTQWRGATNADLVSWGAVLYDAINDKMYQAPLRVHVPIADRTGGGDSFASGVLAALLMSKDLETAVQWGAAHGILVQETPGDITMVDLKAVIAEVARASASAGVRATR